MIKGIIHPKKEKKGIYSPPGAMWSAFYDDGWMRFLGFKILTTIHYKAWKSQGIFNITQIVFIWKTKIHVCLGWLEREKIMG